MGYLRCAAFDKTTAGVRLLVGAVQSYCSYIRTVVVMVLSIEIRTGG
jgi:hypothetical protein